MYPPSKEGDLFSIPSDVGGFGNFPFKNIRFLKKIYYPMSVKRADYSFAFSDDDKNPLLFDVYFEGSYNECHDIWFDRVIITTGHNIYYDVKEFPQ